MTMTMQPAAGGPAPYADFSPSFLCPITNELMRDPLMSKYGTNYERSAILHHLQAVGGTCPVTGKPLKLSELLPNKMLQDRILGWCQANGYDDVEMHMPPCTDNRFAAEVYVNNSKSFAVRSKKMKQQRRCSFSSPNLTAGDPASRQRRRASLATTTEPGDAVPPPPPSGGMTRSSSGELSRSSYHGESSGAAAVARPKKPKNTRSSKMRMQRRASFSSPCLMDGDSSSPTAASKTRRRSSLANSQSSGSLTHLKQQKSGGAAAGGKKQHGGGKSSMNLDLLKLTRNVGKALRA